MTLERRGSHLVPRPFQINVFLGLDLSALFEFRLPRHGELCALSETFFPLSRRPSSRSRLQFFFWKFGPLGRTSASSKIRVENCRGSAVATLLQQMHRPRGEILPLGPIFMTGPLISSFVYVRNKTASLENMMLF
jgi:hypothetical protein